MEKGQFVDFMPDENGDMLFNGKRSSIQWNDEEGNKQAINYNEMSEKDREAIHAEGQRLHIQNEDGTFSVKSESGSFYKDDLPLVHEQVLNSAKDMGSALLSAGQQLLTGDNERAEEQHEDLKGERLSRPSSQDGSLSSSFEEIIGSAVASIIPTAGAVVGVKLIKQASKVFKGKNGVKQLQKTTNITDNIDTPKKQGALAVAIKQKAEKQGQNIPLPKILEWMKNKPEVAAGLFVEGGVAGLSAFNEVYHTNRDKGLSPEEALTRGYKAALSVAGITPFLGKGFITGATSPTPMKKNLLGKDKNEKEHLGAVFGRQEGAQESIQEPVQQMVSNYYTEGVSVGEGVGEAFLAGFYGGSISGTAVGGIAQMTSEMRDNQLRQQVKEQITKDLDQTLIAKEIRAEAEEKKATDAIDIIRETVEESSGGSKEISRVFKEQEDYYKSWRASKQPIEEFAETSNARIFLQETHDLVEKTKETISAIDPEYQAQKLYASSKEQEKKIKDNISALNRQKEAYQGQGKDTTQQDSKIKELQGELNFLSPETEPAAEIKHTHLEGYTVKGKDVQLPIILENTEGKKEAAILDFGGGNTELVDFNPVLYIGGNLNGYLKKEEAKIGEPIEVKVTMLESFDEVMDIVTPEKPKKKGKKAEPTKKGKTAEPAEPTTEPTEPEATPEEAESEPPEPVKPVKKKPKKVSPPAPSSSEVKLAEKINKKIESIEKQKEEATERGEDTAQQDSKIKDMKVLLKNIPEFANNLEIIEEEFNKRNTDNDTNLEAESDGESEQEVESEAEADPTEDSNLDTKTPEETEVIKNNADEIYNFLKDNKGTFYSTQEIIDNLPDLDMSEKDVKDAQNINSRLVTRKERIEYTADNEKVRYATQSSKKVGESEKTGKTKGDSLETAMGEEITFDRRTANEKRVTDYEKNTYGDDKGHFGANSEIITSYVNGVEAKDVLNEVNLDRMKSLSPENKVLFDIVMGFIGKAGFSLKDGKPYSTTMQFTNFGFKSGGRSEPYFGDKKIDSSKRKREFLGKRFDYEEYRAEDEISQKINGWKAEINKFTLALLVGMGNNKVKNGNNELVRGLLLESKDILKKKFLIDSDGYYRRVNIQAVFNEINKILNQGNKKFKIEDIVREGFDDIPNKSVAQLFKDFGFKGVDIAPKQSLSNRKPRQERITNALYRSFKDLASVLGVSDKAMSLGGKLSLKAKGIGNHRATAIYRTGDILTDDEWGDGSLAHEWGHALDHYQVEGEKNIKNFFLWTNLIKETLITDLDKVIIEHESFEWEKKLKELMAEHNYDYDILKDKIGEVVYISATASNLWLNNKKADMKMGKPYYQTPSEMFARGFETYIEHKLDNRKNNYLIHNIAETMEEEEDYVYSQGDEIPKVIKAFDSFFEALTFGNDGSIVSVAPMKNRALGDVVSEEQKKQAILRLIKRTKPSAVHDRERADKKKIQKHEKIFKMTGLERLGFTFNPNARNPIKKDEAYFLKHQQNTIILKIISVSQSIRDGGVDSEILHRVHIWGYMSESDKKKIRYVVDKRWGAKYKSKTNSTLHGSDEFYEATLAYAMQDFIKKKDVTHKGFLEKIFNIFSMAGNSTNDENFDIRLIEEKVKLTKKPKNIL